MDGLSGEGWSERLIESTRDAFICIDPRGFITLFNAAAEQLFGYDRIEVIGRKVDMLMPEPYRSEHDGYLERYRHTGERRAIGMIRTLEAKRSTGDVFPMELSITEVSSDTGPMYAAFIRDVSEKMTLQAKLVERERLAAIGTTSATLAHEIGNPHSNLLLNLRLLRKKLERLGVSDDGVAASLSTVSDEVARLQTILDEFRSLSRRTQLSKRAVGCQQLVLELRRAIEAEAEASGVTLMHDAPEGIPALDVDVQKLKQAMLNLLKNAVEATGEGGTVKLEAERFGSMVRLGVHDDGDGVPEGVNVFEPFCTTKIRGTGLGLPVSKQIINRHGGRLEYLSQPGKGTWFYAWLPLKVD